MPAPTTCPHHDGLSLRVHDLEGSDGRQWTMIQELGDALEVVQQTGSELNRKLDLQIRDMEHHLADRAAHRTPGGQPQEKRNGAAIVDDTLENLKRIFWRIVELAAVGGALWVAMRFFASVGNHG